MKSASPLPPSRRMTARPESDPSALIVPVPRCVLEQVKNTVTSLLMTPGLKDPEHPTRSSCAWNVPRPIRVEALPLRTCFPGRTIATGALENGEVAEQEPTTAPIAAPVRSASAERSPLPSRDEKAPGG